ncbi:MAG: hypothetical protein QM770_03910 [Tepidisphaeraceae bacterium]
MPEVFTNRYRFNDRAAVPTAQAIQAALADAWGVAFGMETQQAGFHGALRDYAKLTTPAGEDPIWIFWEAERPEVELQVIEPMAQMIPCNAALAKLGGTPEAPDAFWHARAAGRMQAKINKIVVIAIAVALAVLAIVKFGWWGVLAVVLIIVLGAALFVWMLAQAFKH